MRLVVGPLGLGLDLILEDGDGSAVEVARGLYVVKSDDGTLLRVYLAGLDLQNTGIHLELTPNRSGAPLPRVELDRLLRRVRLVVSDELPSEFKTVLPGIEFGIDDKEGPLFISVPHASLAEDESVTMPITFAGVPQFQRYPGLLTHLDGCDPDALLKDMRGS